ncbi:MAG TPA: MG2 domain-containing protein, partial [Rhodocyclaceae bacterium]
ERDSRGFRIPDAADLPTTLTIRHEASGTEYTQPLRWEAGGSATSQWKIPEAAKRGTYTVTLSGAKSGAVQSGEFQVSDFRLPVFAGSVQGVPNRQIAPKEVPLALGLSFLNGGAAKNQPVQVSATLRPRWPTFEHYANYSFYVDFDREGQGAFNVDEGREHEQLVLDKQALSLDKAGAGKLTVPLKEQVRGPSEVYAEMTFTDPNGEVQTIHGSVELWPAAVVAGIGVKDWAAASGAQGAVDVVVLGSASGKPEVGTEVRVIAKRRVDYSHRRRVVGGFYAYEHHSEFVDLGEVCRGRSDTKGLFHCNVDAREPGSIYLLAEVRDGNGNAVRAGTSFWVAGRGDTWFTAGNQDRIDVLPEKRSYQAGETARLQVRTPFREATALISIEAGGVLDSYVQPLSRFKPVVEIPVKGEWGPNAFVSVLLVRGRVQPPTWYSFFQWGWREPIAWFREWWQPEQPTAMVDLAKPAYRLGLAEIGVGTESFKLKVEASTDKQDYRPRDPVTVKLKVRAPDGKPLPAGSEVAIAAVDQALLELKPNESWNLLEAMLQKRGYEVETATAQGQVIGKRHFGRKAVPAGGGGGRAPARELFDTLLLWNPHLKLDAEGMATVQVPLNDSLSEFRIVAIATAGSGLFGTGDARVRTKQDLQMISGLPPLVREKDQFQALLTLRNGTAKPMQVSVHARLGDKELETREVKLEAEGAAELSWSGTAPENASKLTWEFSAEDKNGSARDRLRITQQVAPAVPVTVQQASFSRIEGHYEIAATQPAGALPGRGGIEVALSPKLSAIPPGVTRYFEQYPFGCLEQRSSIAVGLHDPKRWQTVVDSLPAYLDNEGLARYFPGEGPGSVALTAYLLDISREAGFALPDEARQRMLQGLTRFVEGRLKREPRPYRSPAEDLLANKLTALEALTRAGAATTSASAAAAARAV